MSSQASPPPASINIASTKTLPRSCTGSRSPLIGMRFDNESPSPQPVGEGAQRVQADMGDDLVAAAFHHHRDCAVTVHLASALQVRGSDASTTSESLTWRAFPRMPAPQTTNPRERSGLIIAAGPRRA